jgi:hypothetical protein
MKRILKENERFEKKSPYNFCDRWCERCTHEKQMRCRLYHDELEDKLTCIAHGREPDDPEITGQVMQQRWEDVMKKLEKDMEKYDINPDDIDGADTAELDAREESARKEPLNLTTKEYCKRSHKLLKSVFYEIKGTPAGAIADLETVNWYHTLLPAKLYRALCDLREKDDADEFGLCDAVAQFAVCKKAIACSVAALRNLKPHYSEHAKTITLLVALLNNILHRIEMIEDAI